jgi:hypothetical protein
LPKNFDSRYLAILNDGMALKVRGESKSEMNRKNTSWCLDDTFCTSGIEQVPPFGLKKWIDKKTDEFLDLKITQVYILPLK